MKKSCLRPIVFLLLIVLINVSVAAQTNVSINPGQKRQLIKGWGVSLCWWANLVGGMPAATMDSITKMAAVDLNLNVFRFNIGGGENPNCSSGQHIRPDGGDMPGYRSQCADQAGWGTYTLANDFRQIAVMDKLSTYRSDIITECFSNSPPWWMCNSLCSAGNTGGTENINPDYLDDFADYLATVTAALKNRNAAWNVSYIEPFNEPLSNWWTKGNNQEGCYISPATQATILWRLWQSQSTYGISSLGLAASDCNTVNESISNMNSLKTNNPGEYNGLSIINTHSYSGTSAEKINLKTFAQNNGNKPVWQSETGPISWSPADGTSWWQRHYYISQRLLEDVRDLQSEVWCDWQLMSTDEGWGMLQQTNFNAASPFQAPTYIKTRGYYCRKNISNFIKAGYQIVSSNNANTLSALNADSTEAVVVIVNYGNTPVAYTIDLNQFQVVNSFRTFRTSGDYNSAENCTEKTINTVNEKGTLSGKLISYNAPAYSVTTFVVNTDRKPIVNFSSASVKCVHQSIQFTDLSNNNPGSWNWSVSPSAGVTLNSAASQNPTINFSSAGTYTVTHTATNSIGTGAAFSQTVTINPQPVLTPYLQLNGGAWQGGNTAFLCEGGSVWFGPQPIANGWQYTGPNGYTSNIRDPLLNSIATTQSGNYTATYTNAQACSNSIIFSITVLALPNKTTTQNGAVISASQNGATYQWLDCNTGKSTIAGATNQSYTAPATGDYAVIVTLNGCSDTSACVHISTVGINPASSISHTTIYPNPSTGSFTVVTDVPPKTIVVTDLLGNELSIIHPDSTKTNISLNERWQGFYILKITFDKTQVIQRVLIDQ